MLDKEPQISQQTLHPVLQRKNEIANKIQVIFLYISHEYINFLSSP